ncbi:MAG: glycosyltransferase family A protein [Azospirillaceae bacterium]
MTAPTLSLVVATRGRDRELRRLLTSLEAVEEPAIEVLIVDQNADSRLDALLASAGRTMSLRHLKTEPLGASHARNHGARRASAPWLAFPDDDCWYGPDTLARLLDAARAAGAGFAAGRPSDAEGREIMGRFRATPGPIGEADVWSCLIEWLSVVRTDAFRAVGGFDTRIGPGSGTPWGACEIQDLALRLLRAGAAGTYDPTIRGYHESDRPAGVSRADRARMRRYGAGCGHVFAKHGLPHRDFAPMLGRPLAGMAVFAATGRWRRAARSFALLRGRIEGRLADPRPGPAPAGEPGGAEPCATRRDPARPPNRA